MILESLYQLAFAEGLVDDPDYELKPIAYLVRIDHEGRFLASQPTKSAPPSQGKKQAKPVARQFLVPREPGRTSGDYACLLFDKAEYLLGKEPPGADKPRTPEQLAKRQTLFRDKVRQCADATGDPAVRAAWRFLDDLRSGSQQVELPADCAANDLFALVFELEELPIASRPSVRNFWKTTRRSGNSADLVRCLVTGELGNLAKKHVLIKGVPGAMTAGAPFVCFNAKAFESFGWEKNRNAPVSQEAADAYATALQRLIAASPVDPANPDNRLATLSVRLGGDAVVCFWSPRSAFAADLTSYLTQPDPDQVSSLYRSVWRGEKYTVPDPNAFYALVLSGSQGRIVARGWLESTVAEASDHLADHFADLKIERNTPKPKDRDLPFNFPLRDLLGSLSGVGKSDGPPPALAEQFLSAALHGREYPLSILQRALLRHRAEMGRDQWADFVRRDARAALIKAVLSRRRRLIPSSQLPEVFPMLDPDNTDPGYLCGRLMAVIERMQQAALGEVNASVVDRFFGAASATPAAVFPRLLRNSRHHSRKAQDDDRSRGLARYLESMIDQVVSRLVAPPGFPPYLSLESQGLFVIGYHHQRHAFFTKKEVAAEGDVAN